MPIDSFSIAKHSLTTISSVLVLATELSGMQSAKKCLQYWSSSQLKLNFCTELSATFHHSKSQSTFFYLQFVTLQSKILIVSSGWKRGTRKLSLGAYWSWYTDLNVVKTTISIFSTVVSIDKFLSAEPRSVITFNGSVLTLQSLRTKLAKNNGSGLFFPINKPAFLKNQWLHFIQQGVNCLCWTLVKKYGIVSSLDALSFP